MTDSQLATIFTSILDLLAERDSDAVTIAKIRDLVLAANKSKMVPFGGSGSVNV